MYAHSLYIVDARSLWGVNAALILDKQEVIDSLDP